MRLQVDQAKASEAVAAILNEFKAVDTRKPQPLSDVGPPVFLRRAAGQEGAGHGEHDASGAAAHLAPSGGDAPSNKHLPRLRLGQQHASKAQSRSGAHGTDEQGAGGHAQAAGWSPVHAARTQLASERPGVLERMDMIVDHCRIARDNRNYRLNSLGVFDGSKNEVRARSMLRVHMHKELSATSLRLPHTQKEIKLERPDDSLNARLERMFVRVLKSLDVEKPQAHHHRPAPLNVKGSPQLRQRDHHSPGPLGHASSPGAHALSPGPAGPSRLQDDAGGHLRGLGGGPTLSMAFADLDVDLATPGAHRGGLVSRQASRANSGRYTLQRPTSTRRVSSNLSSFSHVGPMTPKSPQGGGWANRNDWVANLPPEVAAAQIAHLTAVTKVHIGRYHAAVVEAQQDALALSGMPGGGSSELSAAQLAAQLAEQLSRQQQEEKEKEMAAGTKSNTAQEAGGAASGEVSKLVHTTRSIPELISAVLKHCSDMSADLDAFRASLPQKKDVKKERRKPSVPMLVAKQQAESAAAGSAVPALAPSAGQQQEGGSKPHAADASGPPSPGIWPSLCVGQVDDDCASSGGENEGATEPHGDEEAAAQAGAGKQQPVRATARELQRPSLSGSLHGGASPAPPPVVNHSPITAQRLAAFQQKLQDVAASVQRGQSELPELPPLPPAPTAAQHVQARLERVWDLLMVPLPARLDSVLAFTSRERALEFEKALQVWEACAVGVPKREEILSTLSHLQLGVSTNSLGYVSLPQVEEQCVELHRITCAIQRAAARLKEVHGIQLTFGPQGDPYPGPEAVTPEDMVAFLEWLRDSPTRVQL